MKKFKRHYRNMEKNNSEYVYDRYIEAIERRFIYSNCYFQKEDLNEWIKEGLVQCYCSEDCFVLVLQKCGFIKLYFLSNSFDWTSKLNEIKKHAGDSEIAIEIVTRGKLDDYDLRRYCLFKKVIQYDRLRSKGIEINEKDEHPSYCKQADFMQLRVMMDENFSSIGDYIPSDKELEGLLDGQNVICVKDRDKVEGFIIFEDKGKTSYVRMVCINKDSRGRGLGERLMKMYFAIHREYKGFTLWCKSDNVPAMRLYEKVGQYSDEDIHNYVFVL